MTRFVKATYHSNIKAAEFIADDGRHLIRTGGSLQWRICNAGNLVSPMINGVPVPRKTKDYIGFAKAASGEHHFFIFPDYETGRAELKASLLRKYQDRTLSETVKVYAPKHDGNNTESYIKNLGKMSGIDHDTKIKDLNDAQLNSLMDSMERLEGYHAEVETRKELWVNVSHIQATDGTRPLADEEIIVRVDGKETKLRSNAVGQFPPIVHGASTAEIHHKNIDGELKKLGELPAEKGQHLSLVTKVAKFFGMTAPIKAPDNPITQKHPLQYTVQPGDTLNKIARLFNISVEQIKQDNHLIKNTILAGQVLGINGPPPHATFAAEAKKAGSKPATPVTSKSAASTLQAGGPNFRFSQAADSQTTAARSKDGKGEPLALIKPDDGVAPWMKYAVSEAMRFKGASENVIEKEISYHSEIKDGLKSLVGTNNAWCAAFVNWCLMNAGYPIENPKEKEFIDRVAAKSRADGFIHLRGKKIEKNQKYDEVPFVVNPLFIKIDEPVYGAIAIVTDSSGHGHHAGFVYSKIDANHVCVLGGNQSQTIKFSSFNIKPIPNKLVNKGKEKKIIKGVKDCLVFLLPSSYRNPNINGADALQYHDPEEMNKSIGIQKKKESGERETTR